MIHNSSNGLIDKVDAIAPSLSSPLHCNGVVRPFQGYPDGVPAQNIVLKEFMALPMFWSMGGSRMLEFANI
jgi:hypothetical protein